MNDGGNGKRKRPSRNGSKGFGASGDSSSSSSAGVALVRPTTSPEFRYSGSVRPGLQTPRRTVPTDAGIKFPDYAADGMPKNRPALFPWVIEVKRPEEIERMRRAGRCAREVLDLAGRAVGPGITT
jgi:methionyl aminopeptidase